MPRGDGTGPTGTGPVGGGKTSGSVQGGGKGLGAGKECLCPQRDTRAPHEHGIPCTQQKCPQCGSLMVRV